MIVTQCIGMAINGINSISRRSINRGNMFSRRRIIISTLLKDW